MVIKLNEDELTVYHKAEKVIASHLNDHFNDMVYDKVYDMLIDHNWGQEFNMPPGSQAIDAAADRIVYNLRERFYIQDEL
jgi:hypothetical protein